MTGGAVVPVNCPREQTVTLEAVTVSTGHVGAHVGDTMDGVPVMAKRLRRSNKRAVCQVKLFKAQPGVTGR